MTALFGPVPTFYGNDCTDEVRACERLLTLSRPSAVQLHTWAPDAPAQALRRALPSARIVCGFGVDGIAREVALGEKSVEQGMQTFLALAGRASDVGALAVVWNAEASWKRPPSSEEAARIAAVVRRGLAAVADQYPYLEQHHTAYDHPSFHSTYPWKAWLGAGSPIVASWPQVYAAGAGGLQAHRGALPAREARALASWASAIRAGWIAPDDDNTTIREGVAWRPYYQLHHVTTADTVASALEHDAAMLWALRSRSDSAGRLAFLAMCCLARANYWRPGGLTDYQRDNGLKVDGVCGPATLAAMGAIDV